MIIYGIYPPLPSVDLWQLTSSLLPSPDDDATMHNNLATHVSRVLVNIDFFKVTCLLVGTSSINSRSRCQENRMRWVSLLVEIPVGSSPQNKNKGDEVVEIMSNLHQYIPTVKCVEDCFIPSTGVTWSFIIAVSGLMTTTMEPSAVAPPVASSLSIYYG